MLIEGMQGLGDNIYQRAWMRRFTQPVYLRTPWPELYEDLPNVRFVRPLTKLRTQSKNAQRQTVYQPLRVDGSAGVKTIRYGTGGIIPGMTRAFGFQPSRFDLPDFGPRLLDRPYVLVRPVTVRAEWRADARNPLPEYVAEAAAHLRALGYAVVSVADLADGAEWALDPLPVADYTFHAGELDVRQLMALVQHAAAVVGGIGWIVPAALAAKVPAWIVCGGQGAYNAPALICPAESSVTFAVPDKFCRCRERQHTCNKRIKNHACDFARWSVQLPVVV